MMAAAIDPQNPECDSGIMARMAASAVRTTGLARRTVASMIATRRVLPAIPCEGSVTFPYVIALVKNAPNKEKAKKVLDFTLSDKGQAIWTNAFLRPARAIPLPPEVKAKFLPESDYARANDVDWGQMEKVQKAFTDRYLAEVR